MGVVGRQIHVDTTPRTILSCPCALKRLILWNCHAAATSCNPGRMNITHTPHSLHQPLINKLDSGITFNLMQKCCIIRLLALTGDQNQLKAGKRIQKKTEPMPDHDDTNSIHLQIIFGIKIAWRHKRHGRPPVELFFSFPQSGAQKYFCDFRTAIPDPGFMILVAAVHGGWCMVYGVWCMVAEYLVPHVRFQQRRHPSMKYKYNTNKRVSCILYNLQCCIVFIYPPRANKQQQKQHQRHWQQKLQQKNRATEIESTEQQMATNVGYFAAWFAGWLAHWLPRWLDGHADNLSAAHLGQVRAISWAEHNDIVWKCLQMSCENLSLAALNSCAEAETQWQQQ